MRLIRSMMLGLGLALALTCFAVPVQAAEGGGAGGGDMSPGPASDHAFPVIFYAVGGRDSQFAEAKEWGATYVHRYGMGRSVKKDQPYFDMAAKHGLKVMSDLRGRKWVKEDDGVKTMRHYVEHFKDHPALGFWYLIDEPDNKHVKAEKLLPFYRMLKQVTPNVPIAIAHAWSKHWYNYGSVEDILMTDNYPVAGAPFPKAKLNSWTRFSNSAASRAKKDGDRWIPVIQMFSWKAAAKKGDKKKRGYPVDKLRYPNATEMRYMIFSSIAMGADGLSFYSYSRSRQVDGSWGGRVLAPVLKQAKKFEKKVAGGRMKRLKRAQDEDLFISAWNVDGDIYVMLCNAYPQSRQVGRSTADVLGAGTLEPWGNTRDADATLKNGKITIKQAKPWEVFIWQVKSSK